MYITFKTLNISTLLYSSNISSYVFPISWMFPILLWYNEIYIFTVTVLCGHRDTELRWDKIRCGQYLIKNRHLMTFLTNIPIFSYQLLSIIKIFIKFLSFLNNCIVVTFSPYLTQYLIKSRHTFIFNTNILVNSLSYSLVSLFLSLFPLLLLFSYSISPLSNFIDLFFMTHLLSLTLSLSLSL